MSSNDLELAFYGELHAGFNQDDVKTNVAELFKASVDQVERMFTGHRVVIRNKLDAETAQKYAKAMAKRGAVCKVELMGQPGVEYVESGVSAADVTSVAAEPMEQRPTNGERSGFSSQSPQASASNGLPVAGEEVDSILASSGLSLDPVGVRLSDESAPVAKVELTELAKIDVLPPGSDLVEPAEEVPVSVPDTSHISLKSD
jgi:hypothetical protein